MPTGLPWNSCPRRAARSALRSSASDFLCCGDNFLWREGFLASSHHSAADNPSSGERSSFDVGGEPSLPITDCSFSLPPCARARGRATPKSPPSSATADGGLHSKWILPSSDTRRRAAGILRPFPSRVGLPCCPFPLS